MSFDIITAQIEKNMVFIKLPLLRPKTDKKITSASSKLIAKEFGEAVFSALDNHKDKKLLLSTAYLKKTIFYLFVLGPSSPQIDNDNYETTAVTNAIAGFFYGADSPLTCRFVFDSVFDESITSGTYITVIPDGVQLITNEMVVEYWKNLTYTNI